MQVLADTSVILNSLLGIDTAASRQFARLMRSGPAPSITPEVFQEVLQGARDAANFSRLRGELVRLPMLEPADIYNSRSQAAWMYAAMRWQGVTVRSTIDCLIAQTAIEHDLPLLHDDKDYLKIAGFEPRLKLA